MSSSLIKTRLVSLLQDWLVCYQIMFPEYKTPEAAAQRINNGECGNTAQAIFLILEKEFPGQDHVQIFANLNHAFLLHGDLGYDVQVQEGEPINFFNEKYMDLDSKACTVPEVFLAYTHCDPLGCILIRAFLARHDTPYPEFYQKVIDEEAVGDELTWLQQYLEREPRIINGEGKV